MINSELFADLGIPIDYGRDPRRPAHAEAQELEDVEPNILGRMQKLAPTTARACRPLTVEFDASPAFAWLGANARRFGFSMPYVRDNVYGFSYEPWHWSQLGLRGKRAQRR